jgi:hypothetical protein
MFGELFKKETGNRVKVYQQVSKGGEGEGGST